MSNNSIGELDYLSNEEILNPNFQKKKLIFWIIRMVISVIIYIILWKYDWIKWTLFLTAPLSLFSLFTIIGAPYFIKRKIEKTRLKIDEINNITRKSE